jgi:DNA polymerase III subunit epsilon
MKGGRVPWRAASWCVVDLELTGLDPEQDEIISFGAIPIEDGRLLIGGAVGGLARPTRQISEDSIRLHGIRAVDLAAAPVLGQAIDPLVRVIAGRVLVAHTAVVERTFLGRAFKAKGLRLRGPVADTEVLGRLWLHERDGQLWERLPLTVLARELGLPAERPHHALGDALTTAQAFIALATHLDAIHRETVSTITHAGRRIAAIRAFHLG